MLAHLIALGVIPTGGGLPVDDGDEPVTIAEARVQCRVEGAADDVQLDALRKAARAYVEAYTGLTLLARNRVVKFASWSDLHHLPVAPVAAVTIAYVDPAGVSRTLAPASYELFIDGLEAGIYLSPGYSWPSLARTRAPIAVTATCSFVAAPDMLRPIRQAMLLLIAQWFDNPSAIITDGTANSLPNSVDALLANYRVYA